MNLSNTFHKSLLIQAIADDSNQWVHIDVPENYTWDTLTFNGIDSLSEEKANTLFNDIVTREALKLLKIERNKLIQESDWMANSDVVMSDEWKVYRQTLRDLPETQTPSLDDNGNLIDVEWPIPPGEISGS